MIAIGRQDIDEHGSFLSMLSAIQRKASIVFHELPDDDRQDLIVEVVANAFVASSGW